MNGLPWDLQFEPATVAGVTVAAEYDAVSGRLKSRLTNRSADPLQPRELRLTATPNAGSAGGSLWLHGRYMQMDALVRNLGTPSEEGYDGRYVAPADAGRRYISREVGVAVLPSHATPALLAGSLRPDRFFFNIEYTVDDDESHMGALALTFDLDGIELGPGESLDLPPVLLIEGRDPLTLIKRYADEVGAEMKARVPGHVPTGWCSWYYFYNRVSEADVVANLGCDGGEQAPGRIRADR